jgi:hypothetical protein
MTFDPQVFASVPQSGQADRGAKKLPIYIGEKFFRLTVVALGKTTDGHGHRYHLCACSCRPDQKPRPYREDFLRSARVKSCGCLRAETQWSFGTKKSKPRKKSCGVGETSTGPKIVEVPQVQPIAGGVPAVKVPNLLRAPGKARREALASFQSTIDRLVSTKELAATAVPNLSNQQIIKLLIDDDPPNSSLPSCLQKPALAIAQKLWNKIMVEEGASMSNGKFMPSAEQGKGLIVLSDDIEAIAAHPNDGSGRRVRPEGNGPDKFSSNYEANGSNFSKAEPNYKEIVDAAAKNDKGENVDNDS